MLTALRHRYILWRADRLKRRLEREKAAEKSQGGRRVLALRLMGRI